MRYSFPVAFMANSFGMTILLIVLGLAGESSMAAEIGIVQSATLALLYAFSANARSLILSKAATVSAYSVAIWRMFLLVPLAFLAYWLSAGVAGVETLLAIILITRRCVDWLNEIHLSELESLGCQDAARKYILLQSASLLFILIWLLCDFPYPMLALCIWAFLPLLFSLKFIVKSIEVASDVFQRAVLTKVLPHFGSTAIIGITVYVFRLLILLLAGKEIAGDLYTAFAIGGLTGSVFANALGASIALHEERSGARYFPSFLRHFLNLAVLAGILIFAVAKIQFVDLGWTGKSFFFWQATGLSLIGGVIMVYAQRIRFRLLQGDEEHDVFGPDVMMNILIIALVPFVFYLFGPDALCFLYMFSSLLAYVFYFSARNDAGKNQIEPTMASNILRAVIGMLLLLPLFFQLSHGIFTDTSENFNSGGALRDLPIPVSVLACYAGILLLGGYKRAFVSFGFVFLICVLMMLSTIISTQGQAAEQQAKFILLIQFVLPMIALVLGQIYESKNVTSQNTLLAKAFFWVLVLIVPPQLFFTWDLGKGYLSPQTGFFSIYQHLQYLPVVFVSAYLITFFSLWSSPRYKLPILLLFPLMAIYSAASLSMLAMVLLPSGLLIFALLKLKSERLPLLVFFLSLVLSLGYLQYQKNQPMMVHKFGFAIHSMSDAAATKKNADGIHAIRNVSARLDYWKYYWGEITGDKYIFLLGSPERPARSEYPSAHNYYLDFIYNFGALALLPLLLLLGYTILMVVRHRRQIFQSPSELGLCLVVLFLLIIDNSLKVGLRQPYPAIFTFFLWGLLLAKLSVLTKERKHAAL